jgi:hypothetical protein
MGIRFWNRTGSGVVGVLSWFDAWCAQSHVPATVAALALMPARALGKLKAPVTTGADYDHHVGITRPPGMHSHYSARPRQKSGVHPEGEALLHYAELLRLSEDPCAGAI